MNCWCCGRKRHVSSAVVRWSLPTGYRLALCQSCLDSWLDNADDDSELEPLSLCWLDGCRTLVGVA